MWDTRLHKTAWEVDRLRTSAAALERVFAVMPDRITPGMSEREISRAFSIAQLEQGAHEVGPHGSVASMDRGLFGGPTERRWDASNLLYLDGAPIIDGYWADYCRTYATRPATASERSGYERVLSGLDAALEAFHPGCSAADLGRAMRKAMGVDPAAVGFGRFGHGIGLHVPEPPSLHPEDPTVLRPGFTFCIEPTVCHDGINYVVEETYVVTGDGLERISPPAPGRSSSCEPRQRGRGFGASAVDRARELHRQPELAFAEHRTAAAVVANPPASAYLTGRRRRDRRAGPAGQVHALAHAPAARGHGRPALDEADDGRPDSSTVPGVTTPAVTTATSRSCWRCSRFSRRYRHGPGRSSLLQPAEETDQVAAALIATGKTEAADVALGLDLDSAWRRAVGRRRRGSGAARRVRRSGHRRSGECWVRTAVDAVSAAAASSSASGT